MKKSLNVEQIMRAIEEIAPRTMALPGDPVGLQCGDADKSVKRMMIALDATADTVAQAVAARADLLLTHHPLLFEPLSPDTINGPAGRTLALAIREGLAVYSAHTNLDASPHGINACLADLLDLADRQVLQADGPGSCKVVVFVPGSALEKVRSAAFKAGAGIIGSYSGCSFSVDGTGTFTPEAAASPAVGQAGRPERVPETRLELSVGRESVETVLSAVRGAHPYEEPAVDVYTILPGKPAAGLGISGTLPRQSTVGHIAARIRSSLRAGHLRLVGKKGNPVRRVAVCAGSGASLMERASSSGAQLYITGDMKYHDARKAGDMGLMVLDVGHFAPERYGVVMFGKLMEKQFSRQGFGVEVLMAKEKDPFVPVP